MSINFNHSPSILCLGDSLTELGSQPGGYVQRLTETYSRRLDVVNRGFYGFNTEWILPVVEKLIVPSEVEGGLKIALVTIWIGSNDSSLPGFGPHVPLDRYKKNLRIIHSLYASTTPTVFITPAPFLPMEPDMDPEVTRTYAEAMKEVAEELGCSIVDSQKAFDGQDLKTLVVEDGIHLTPAGYTLIFNELMRVIRSSHSELAPENLPMTVPSWDDPDMRRRAREHSGRRQ